MIEMLFKSAREELMKRIDYRDSYLQRCLLSLVVLFCLGENIEIFGVKSTEIKGPLYLLAFPIAITFLGLYLTEEHLIGDLSAYIASLSRQANQGKSGKDVLIFWDDSSFLKENIRSTMLLRICCTFFVFTGLPMVLLLGYFLQEKLETKLQIFSLVISSVLGLVSCWWQIREYRRRLKIVLALQLNSPDIESLNHLDNRE